MNLAQDLQVELGNKNNLDAIEQLYDASVDHLTQTINYPGWQKGKYPNRDTATVGIENGTLYVVKQEEEIIATVILDHHVEDGYHGAKWGIEAKDTEVLVIHTLVVHPNCLNVGIGKKIMNFIIDLAMTTQMKAIRLDIYSKNDPARKLYEKYGFKYIDRVDLGRRDVGLAWFDLYEKLL